MISQQELEVVELIQRAMRAKSTSLNLEKYKLTTLPESLINLPDLSHLNLDIDLLEDLSILQSMYSLSTVSFLRTSRIYLPRQYWTKVSEWEPIWFLDEESWKVRYFLFQKFGLERIIEDLSVKISYPFKLDLRGFNLIDISANIGKLVNLVKLDLGGNKLTTIPASIGNLVNLEKLLLYDNELAELPDSIGYLHNLKELYLGDNKLSVIPDSIGNLINLNKLVLHCNYLNNLPNSIFNIPNLQHLSVQKNQLDALPENIGDCTELNYLNLQENKLDRLPESITNLGNLVDIILAGNPLHDLSILQLPPQLKGVYFLYVFLHRRYWTKLSDWKPEWLLDEDNVEIKVLLIEHFGYETICQKLDAIELDTWREYTLLKIDAEVDVEPMVLLKMTCPSAAHIHILRVPPEMTSAESAITWVNHGIHPDEFAVQT